MASIDDSGVKPTAMGSTWILGSSSIIWCAARSRAGRCIVRLASSCCMMSSRKQRLLFSICFDASRSNDFRVLCVVPSHELRKYLWRGVSDLKPAGRQKFAYLFILQDCLELLIQPPDDLSRRGITHEHSKPTF